MNFLQNLPRLNVPRWVWWILALVVLLVIGRYLIAALNPRNQKFFAWFSDADARPSMITMQSEPCPGAPFALPTQGFIGLLYEDPRGPYNALRPHQGIDIFGDGEPGMIPVTAAYSGYLTREENWISAVIIRVPDDPLQPGRQIWNYYTHMASRDGQSFIHEAFPPGTREVYVEQGTLLGYMGNYSGDPANPVGLHLHFSVVKDDGAGNYTNELEFSNTLDPGPYLGMTVNYKLNPDIPIGCNE